MSPFACRESKAWYDVGQMKLNEHQKKILMTEVWFEFTRSQGAGGQHVNKTESAVVLNWSPAHTKALSAPQIDRLTMSLANRITDAGLLKIRCETSRERERNRRESLQKLYDDIEQALYVPKARKATRPTRSSVRKRVEGKRVHSEKKTLRRKIEKD